jgi:hypothetical protein
MVLVSAYRVAPLYSMALDAFVYCDCFEKDNLRCNPPGGLTLKIASNGDITCDAPTEREWMAFATWKQEKACLHPGMILKHFRLGTDTQINRLREQLAKKERSRYPILFNQILYSGTHTCDWLPLPVLPQLTEELKQLNPDRTPEGETIRHLKIQLAELIIVAQMVNKPICF